MSYYTFAVPVNLTMGSTLNGLIKSLNKYNVTSDEMPQLIEMLKSLNTTATFKAGETIFVPVLERNIDVLPNLGPT